MSFTNVAIIGGGLSGLSLALFLKRQGLNPTIYERSDASRTSEGALMLSPNALRTLDVLGAYHRIQAKGYQFQHIRFNTVDHQTIDTYEMGGADKYGYDALRIYRQILLDELKRMVDEAGVRVTYNKKFSHITAEDEQQQGVTFAFADGEQATADLLIGADGIHSTLRGYLAPGAQPIFQNAMGVSCAIPTARIAFPFAPYPLPVGIHGAAGAFVMAPQNPEGSEVFAGIQYRTHERDRAGWEALGRDKERLLGMIRATYDTWNPMVRSAIDAIPVETMSFWPYYTVPKLERWSSEAGMVVMVGDAAHAVPPSSGQGCNQAFEDAHSLSLVIKAVREKAAVWSEGLRWWQQYRQARMARIDDLVDEMNKRRLPGWNGEGAETIDSGWLYDVNIERDVASWLKASG